MKLGEKILNLRKKKGLSQENLSELIDVTRQTISNWELGITSPNPEQLKKLSQILNISIDKLLDNNEFINNEQTSYGFEYVSKIKIKNIPLVHINLGLGRGIRKAKGIIAIGNISKGIISLGAISMGVFSLGALSFGLISLGALTLGLLLSIGGFSIGTISMGGLALGIFSIGGISIGIYSIGGIAIAKNIASGDYAYGYIAIGNHVKGTVELITNETTPQEISEIIRENLPKTWNIIIKIISNITY